MLEGVKQRKPEKVLFNDQLYILWKDGHESHYDSFFLRDSCPCAHCIDELTGKKVLDSQTLPKNIRIRQCEYVGNYALHIHWSDGHDTGFYPFKWLRKVCPCSLCGPIDPVEN